MKWRIAAAVLAVAAAGGTAAAVASLQAVPPPPPPPFTAPQTIAHAVGVATPDLAAFDTACACTPHLAVRYVPWGETEGKADLAYDLEHGAVPLAELEPHGVTLSSIAAGKSDAYLRAFARKVAALHSLTVMSFAPEANNDSYSWGYKHSSPGAFIAAWRHVVTVFRQEKATDVRWMLVVNYSSTHTEALAKLWPGAAYVSYEGIDAYNQDPAETFADAFGPTVRQLRTLSSTPVLVTETAAGAAAVQLGWMRAVIAGVQQYRLDGWVWFDVNQGGGSDPGNGAGNRRDWSIDGNVQALNVYAAATGEQG